MTFAEVQPKFTLIVSITASELQSEAGLVALWHLNLYTGRSILLEVVRW